MKKIEQCVSLRQMKLCAANWTDLTICNKLSNKTNHVMCNNNNNQPISYKLEIKQCVTNFTNLTINKLDNSDKSSNTLQGGLFKHCNQGPWGLLYLCM